MMPLRELAINGSLIVAGTWLVAALLLVVFARTLIYPFQPGLDAAEPTGLPGAEAVRLEAADGTPLIAWLVRPAAGRPVVLYFMGNAGALPAHAPLLAELAGHGLGIAALNYRGAGGAPGRSSEAALAADALVLYDQLDRLFGEPVPADRRVIHGSSLGAALAVRLAAERPSAAVVLESPFNRLCEVARYHYPIFPACLLLPYEHWDSAARIGAIGAPLLIVHGARDATIPLAQGRALFAAAREPKRLVVYPDAGHNDLLAHGAGAEAARFIEEVTR
ncbi:MAG TPA: alpha/beta hydrolase [Thermohalobaculum sp.]|nr:alpha/beta hydrolase [Thermohalobaculum sp.]